MPENEKLRILLIAETANSQWVSVPLVGWSLADALHRAERVHVITQVRNRQSFLDNGYREGVDFTSIDSEKVARPIWKLSNLVRGGEGKGWTTAMAFSLLSYYYFEHLVWKLFKKRIRDGEFDIVHRITPLSPTLPSVLAKKCRKAGVPFVIGPLNGGVPWPRGFDASRRKEKEWLSYIRDMYKLMPGYASTLKYSNALILGSSFTKSKIPARYQAKSVFMPENAINPADFSARVPSGAASAASAPLRACFVGRLVPYKGPDMLLEAALPFLKDGRMGIDIVGDGPLMEELKAMVEDQGISSRVRLLGWVEHSKVQEVMRESSILAFPSIREFGGGVILEAMAVGLVPVVMDYAGPGDLVDPSVGIKVPMGERSSIVAAFRGIFAEILEGRHDLERLAEASVKRVRDYYTWDKKASQVREVYRWVLGRGGEKPDPFGCDTRR